VFTAPLRSNGSYLIVACVFVAAGICLPSRCLAMNIHSDFTISAFGTHITVFSHLRLGLPNDLLPSVHRSIFFLLVLDLSYAYYKFRLSYLPSLITVLILLNDTNYEDPYYQIVSKPVTISSMNKERFNLKRGINRTEKHLRRVGEKANE
jgi:hypothetical protein